MFNLWPYYDDRSMLGLRLSFFFEGFWLQQIQAGSAHGKAAAPPAGHWLLTLDEPKA